MAKLQPDYIKWVLKLNASQAREEYHKLEKSNKDLQLPVFTTEIPSRLLSGVCGSFMPI